MVLKYSQALRTTCGSSGARDRESTLTDVLGVISGRVGELVAVKVLVFLTWACVLIPLSERQPEHSPPALRGLIRHGQSQALLGPLRTEHWLDPGTR
jgi:hypothetical protein